MSVSLDIDMRAALHSTLEPILAQIADQNLSEELLKLTVSQFAELYPTLKETMPTGDLQYLEVAAIVLSHTNPPLQPRFPPLPSAWVEYLDSLPDSDKLSQELIEKCVLSIIENNKKFENN
ncbi:hypothetical protein ARMSODRAFT_1015845 [Armillaria solidipes]|uniref:Uncharacterized protein n=1 Tax=Armillaria solidipes TaxID=1076256 RepID=A0A2H3BQ82_9AGAR|nr:hypothetical protein ARMSODRAFT_1015845 [Armillaria solidipes]